MNTDEINGDVPPKPASIDFGRKEFTPPSPPDQILDSIAVFKAVDEMKGNKWGWWQASQP
jgi:hypothetical protein